MKMRKSTILSTELFDFLENKLAPKNFTRFHQSFRRKKTFGWEILHIAVGKYKNWIDIEANVEIRYNELERLYNTILSESANIPTATIGSELGRLSSGGKKYWKISDSTEIPIVGNDILTFFWNFGMKFFKDYSNLEKIFDVFVADGQPTDAYCSIPHIRAQKAVVAAYLLHREDSYFDLVVNKVSYLKGIENPYIADFLEFAFELRSKFERSQKTS